MIPIVPASQQPHPTVGISAATAPRAWKAGAELLVAGSAILAHPEGRPAAVAELRRSLQPDVREPSEGRAVH
jgi:thiamine monophosphate synthase